MASRAVRSWPATPRTPSVPNKRALISLRPLPCRCQYRAKQWPPPAEPTGAALLALGVLRSLTRLLEAVLLPLLDPGVPGNEAGLLQGRAILRVDHDKRAGHAEAQRAGLPGDTAAGDKGDDVKLVLRAQGHERLVDELLVHLVREVVLQRATVDLPLTGAGLDAHAGDRLLAATGRRRMPGDHRAPGDGARRSVLCGLRRVFRRNVGAELVGGVLRVLDVVLGLGASGLSHGSSCFLYLLCDLRDLVRLRLLRLMRVIRTRVHLELGQGLAAERVLRQHAADGLLDRALRVLGHQLAIGNRVQAARVTGVTVRLLLLELVAGQRDLRRVDHDHEVARVDVRGEDRLVLAAEQHCRVAGQTAKHDVRGIDDMPLPLYVTVFRAESAHSPEPSRMYRASVSHIWEGA